MARQLGNRQHGNYASKVSCGAVYPGYIKAQDQP